MPRLESEPVKKESLLEKAGKFILKILGVGVLLGFTYTALKDVAGPWLQTQIKKIEKLVKS